MDVPMNETLNFTPVTVCEHEDLPPRILFYTEIRIDRDYLIWQLKKKSKLDNSGIAEFIGCSKSLVFDTLRKLSAVGSEKDIIEYFRMGFDLHDILAWYAYNPDQCLSCLLNAMMRHGIRRRSRIKSMTLEELENFLGEKELRNAGKKAKDAFCEYRRRLKNPKRYLKENENGSKEQERETDTSGEES